MVRIIDAHDVVAGKKKYIEYAGLSTDEKPTDDFIATGSVFVEVVAGKAYLYDEGSKDWTEV